VNVLICVDRNQAQKWYSGMPITAQTTKRLQDGYFKHSVD